MLGMLGILGILSADIILFIHSWICMLLACMREEACGSFWQPELWPVSVRLVTPSASGHVTSRVAVRLEGSRTASAAWKGKAAAADVRCHPSTAPCGDGSFSPSHSFIWGPEAPTLACVRDPSHGTGSGVGIYSAQREWGLRSGDSLPPNLSIYLWPAISRAVSAQISHCWQAQGRSLHVCTKCAVFFSLLPLSDTYEWPCVLFLAQRGNVLC